METRIKDREYLKQYDLDMEIFKEFNLDIVDVIPTRKVYMAIGEDKEYVLKRVDYKKEDIYFIKYILDSFKNNGFKRVFDYVKTRDGSLYLTYEGSTYCMMEYVQGRECQCSNPIDIAIATRGIAELHIAGKNIEVNIPEKNLLGKMEQILSNKMQIIKEIQKEVSKFPHFREFDEMFMENVQYYVDQMKNSIKGIKKSSYKELCENNMYHTICHHDLAYHNILINDEKAFFVDFDYAIRDLKVHDLRNFINKVMKEYFYDIDVAEKIILEYRKANTLDKKEIEVLYYLLMFPEDFYSISAAYYKRLKNWEEGTFIKRFEKKAAFREDRERFLIEFKNRFL
ncbi:CotS family spore coat protein [Oceanirhabdus sp. W0125-5]|uniref:CotS family spore coat protein n=1 Tax=Oceanirhabdus sp. W0125-5 TaxID=2999116 RepID=UPI0022F33196|nr:CotS family spore coat protein [Oceanirhabdus sp. W0125-5]WBW98440.1 CotS family spore coat protein [Oceanirhabdus sp. W0125-5]